MYVACNCPQVVQGLTIAHVTGTDDLLNLAGHKKFSKFARQIGCPMGKMKVTFKWSQRQVHSFTWRGQRSHIPMTKTSISSAWLLDRLCCGGEVMVSEILVRAFVHALLSQRHYMRHARAVLSSHTPRRIGNALEF
jgi:hypothetical protein